MTVLCKFFLRFGLVKKHHHFFVAKRSTWPTVCEYHSTDRTYTAGPVLLSLTHHPDIWVFSETRLAQNREVLVKMGKLVERQAPKALPSRPLSCGGGEGARSEAGGQGEPAVQHRPGGGRGCCMHFREAAGVKTRSKRVEGVGTERELVPDPG